MISHYHIFNNITLPHFEGYHTTTFWMISHYYILKDITLPHFEWYHTTTFWRISHYHILKDITLSHFEWYHTTTFWRISHYHILKDITLPHFDSLGGVVVKCPPHLREVAGSIPGWSIPNTLKMVVMAALLGAQGCGVSITTDWLVSGLIDQNF